MYRDASDIGNLVDGSCMNLVGSSAAQMTLDFFQMIAGNAAVTRHTSVLFAGAGSAWEPRSHQDRRHPRSTCPKSGPPPRFSARGRCRRHHAAGRCLRVPELDGFGHRHRDGRSQLRLLPGCHLLAENPNRAVRASLAGGDLARRAWCRRSGRGAHHVIAHGASCGWDLSPDWSLQVLSPGSFSLLYGAKSAPTNLATPVMFDVTTDGSLSPAQRPPARRQLPHPRRSPPPRRVLGTAARSRVPRASRFKRSSTCLSPDPPIGGGRSRVGR